MVRPAVYDRRQREAWVVGSVLLLLPPLFTQGIYGLGVCRLVLIFCLRSERRRNPADAPPAP